MLKKLIVVGLVLVFLVLGAAGAVLVALSSDLPKLISIADYEPLLVTEVFDRNGLKVGEFSRERRKLIPMDKVPDVLVKAFVAAEDSAFFEHKGINFLAILRAGIANLRAGRSAQGGSTITQQVARALLLSSEKTLTRKIKEAILAYRMESYLSKEEILYLYLNQIYFGHGAYGVEVASETYFKKPASQLGLAEAAMLAGLPQAPSLYSPVLNPDKAKARQKYVLSRMQEEGFVTKAQAEAAIKEPLKVFFREKYEEKAPFYVEAVRQMLVKKLGENQVLDKGLKIELALDLKAQELAQKKMEEGLRDLDKRQGFRGAKKNIKEPKEIAEFLLKTRNGLLDKKYPYKQILEDGSVSDRGPLDLAKSDAPDYLSLGDIVPAVVYKLDDELGLVYARFAEERGLIDFSTMDWAREPNPEIAYGVQPIKRPSQALKVGDVIDVKIMSNKFSSERLTKLIKAKGLAQKGKKKPQSSLEIPDFSKFYALELEQEPLVEGALLSIDQKTQEIIAMVGGYDFKESEFNRAIQAARQTGSSFKSFVFAAALEKGFTPATIVVDAPVVYEEGEPPDERADPSGEESLKTWKPDNHEKKFEGEMTFRTALARSLNVPAVKVVEQIGVSWAIEFARRLGIYSPLNPDFTLALGSSSVTLYEMVKAFSVFGRQGRRANPILIKKVTDRSGKPLTEVTSLDERFKDLIGPIEEQFAKKREAYLQKASETKGKEQDQKPNKEPQLYFNDPDQVMDPATAYVITNLLQGPIEEPDGTAARARSLGRPAAGKTGTTSNYFDAWFIGYTAQTVAGVWVGFDKEQSIGKGEVGGRAALPIWLEFMKDWHKDMPVQNFAIPEGVVFVNMDAKTGKLASPSSRRVIKQPFVEGTEPNTTTEESRSQDETNFFKEDLTQ